MGHRTLIAAVLQQVQPEPRHRYYRCYLDLQCGRFWFIHRCDLLHQSRAGTVAAPYNPGLTLTPGSAGTNATIAPVIMQSAVSCTISIGAGIALPSPQVEPAIITVGGNPSLGSLGSTPEFQLESSEGRVLRR